MSISGIWLPVITPFLNGEVDYDSFGNLIDYYIDKNISGIIPLGTTGECPVIDDDEFYRLVETAVICTDGRIPVYIGLGGNDTRKVVKKLKSVSNLDFQGILSVCPYYSRPGQEGIYEHFREISESTDRDIMIYNIPYRTGRNIENDTIFKLAMLDNISGIKDSCGDIKQTMDLLMNRPSGFSVLTGEDINLYITLAMGGDGGVLAASHLDTELYVEMYRCFTENNHQAALEIWRKLSGVIPFYFEEPNPAPLKYLLKKSNLIPSDELRLPLTGISSALREKLDRF